MKKFLTLIISLVLCLSFGLMLVACNNNPDETNPPVTDGETGTPEDSDNNNPSSPEQPTEPANGNILVAYFSWSASGNTEKMATYIAEQTGAFVYEIEPLVPYPTEYTPTTEVAAKEKEENARPEIKNPIDVSTYDHIFVGFPIWWHTAPMIIGTFLESYNLDRKDIYPFFQGASNNNNSYYTETMAFINECAPSANVHDGLYAASTDTAKIDAYLNEIDFTPDIETPVPTERQTIYLWDDDKIPSWRGNLNSNDPADFRPHILTYPAQGEVKGAVLICPGGAFSFKSFSNEGYPVAERLSALGYQCFIVSYRLSPYSQAESALDLARAVRYVRYHAKAYEIDENDIAIVGFSAGGILCGEHALNWKGNVSLTLLDSDYVPDAIDAVNADVAAVGHIYSFYGRLSVSNNNVETLRQGNLPPTFYAYGTRDPFYSQFNQNVEAARQAGVTVESHIFDGQPHGFSAGNANSNWIPLFDTFLANIFLRLRRYNIMKKVLILSGSPRKGGNSDLLCDEFARGAKDSGNEVEKIFVAGKKIAPCLACYACRNTGVCAIKDDMAEVLQKMIDADVIVLASPVYFYSIDAQLKAVIDRTVARWLEVKNKDFYYIVTCADTDRVSTERTLECFRGYADCVEGAKECGVIYGTGVYEKGAIKDTAVMKQAYAMAKRI